ncbi:hypothetical protein X975_23076, partial [Stegodyphus mimosarum]
MDLDEILHDVGDYGKYQKLMLWFVLLPSHLPFGTHYYSQLFMSLTPNHWCRDTVINVDPNVTYRPLTIWSRGSENKLGPTLAICSSNNRTAAPSGTLLNMTGKSNACSYGYDYER